MIIVGCTLINDLVTLYLNKLRINNLGAYHVYVPIIFLLITETFKRSISPVLSTRYLNIYRGLFILFVIVNTLAFQNWNTFNSNAITLAGLSYMVFSLMYFHKLLKSPTYQALEKTPMFWFSTGILLYNSGSLILFFLVNNIRDENRDVIYASWMLNVIFSILYYVSYTIAIWVKPKA